MVILKLNLKYQRVVVVNSFLFQLRLLLFSKIRNSARKVSLLGAASVLRSFITKELFDLFFLV